MAYSSAGGYGEPAWGPARPPVQQPYPPSLGPQPSGALAIVAFIASLVAFFFGWVPFLGLVLGAIGLLLSIIAVRMPVLRGLSIAGIVLSTIAGLTSLVTTGLFLLALLGSSGPAPSQEAAASHSPEDFVEIDSRTLAGIAKDPDAHAGETLILYGYVTQFDADTGPCTMRVSVSADKQSSWLEYEHNSLAFSGDGDSQCPELQNIVADDQVKLTVVLQGGESYNSLGGYTTVPKFEVVDAEVL